MIRNDVALYMEAGLACAGVQVGIERAQVDLGCEIYRLKVETVVPRG